MRQLHVGLEHPVAAEADLHLLGAGQGLDVDVGHPLRLRLQDHGVDQAHQRVVRLLDGPLLVGGFVARTLFQRGQQFARALGVVRTRWGRSRAGQARPGAQVLVTPFQAFAQRPAHRQHGNDLAAGGELHLVQGLGAGRVFHRHDQTVLPNHQGQGAQAGGQGLADPRQCLRFRRELAQVHHGVAHLAHQGRLQALPRDQAIPHQQLPQGHTTVGTLFHDGGLQLLGADLSQRHQSFAQRDDRSARLPGDGLFQFLRGGRRPLLQRVPGVVGILGVVGVGRGRSSLGVAAVRTALGAWPFLSQGGGRRHARHALQHQGLHLRSGVQGLEGFARDEHPPNRGLFVGRLEQEHALRLVHHAQGQPEGSASRRVGETVQLRTVLAAIGCLGQRQGPHGFQKVQALELFEAHLDGTSALRGLQADGVSARIKPHQPHPRGAPRRPHQFAGLLGGQ